MTHGATQKQKDDVAATGPTYENVDQLSQSTVKTTQLYENMPRVSSTHHQSNIEMNQCTAYGVLGRRH